MIGAHVMLAYSKMGQVIDLYVWINVSLFLPQDDPVSALYSFMALNAFVLVCLSRLVLKNLITIWHSSCFE